MFEWLSKQRELKQQKKTEELLAQRGRLFAGSNLSETAESLFTFTVTRDDLVNLTERIMGAIPPHLMTDPERPLTVTVNGGFKSGKKIIPDISRDFLLAQKGQMVGFEEIDEYVTGRIAGQQATVSFINVAFSGFSFNEKFHRSLQYLPYESEKNNLIYGLYLNTRPKKAGISFVHNFHALEREADLNIWIDGDDQSPVMGYSKHFKGYITKRLSTELDTPDLSREWTRYVEITVRNKDLLENKKFMTTLRESPMLNTTDNHSSTPIFKI